MFYGWGEHACLWRSYHHLVNVVVGSFVQEANEKTETERWCRSTGKVCEREPQSNYTNETEAQVGFTKVLFFYFCQEKNFPQRRIRDQIQHCNDELVISLWYHFGVNNTRKMVLEGNLLWSAPEVSWSVRSLCFHKCHPDYLKVSGVCFTYIFFLVAYHWQRSSFDILLSIYPLWQNTIKAVVRFSNKREW